MKKTIVIVLLATVVLSFTACNSRQSEAEISPKSSKETEDSTQIANPFVDCDTLEDACALAGFDISVPETIEGYEKPVNRAIENDLIEIIYQNGDNEIRIRKALGDEDISGDYNEYAENSTITQEDLEIATRGAEGKINVATWVKGDYTYSVSVSDGMENDSLINLIKDIQ